MNVNQAGLPTGGSCRRAFSLLEILAVVAVVAILIGIVAPTLQRARLQGKVTRAQVELRNIAVALEGYMLDYQDKVPPTRSGCSSDVQFQLPVELAVCNYLPRTPGLIPQANCPDVFSPNNGYKYRAPGPIWLNGSYFDYPKNPSKPRASIWVPDDFPECRSPEGHYYYNRKNEPRSPVVYAIWSIGPDFESPKFPRSGGNGPIDESRFPLPRAYWFGGASDRDGLITHFRALKGPTYTSP